MARDFGCAKNGCLLESFDIGLETTQTYRSSWKRTNYKCSWPAAILPRPEEPRHGVASVRQGKREKPAQNYCVPFSFLLLCAAWKRN